MKKHLRNLSIVLIAVLAAILCAFGIGCSNADNGESVFVKTEISRLPTKTLYTVGEDFSAEGGKIKAVYSDLSKKEIDMSAEGVTIAAPDMSTVGTKRVKVTYNSDSAVFAISVVPEVIEPELPEIVTPGGSEFENVVRVTVASAPTTVEYFEGDEFSPEGGMLSLRCSDGTTLTVPMTAKGVGLSAVNTSTAGSKTVTVTVNGRKATFNISVVKLAGVFTYNLGYDGADNDQVRIAENRKAAKPSDPVRNGYTFRGWYEDATCTVTYDFNRVVTDDTSVYASWTSDSAVSYKVTYDMNYYGIVRQTYEQYVEAGQSARPLYAANLATPVRSEFEFGGWYTDANFANAYNGAAISADTTIYAKWNKVKIGTSTYTFEAENTDLNGKSGPGLSGDASGYGMVVDEIRYKASNGKFVSYLYRKGLSLEFRFASSEEVTDATIAVCLSAEFAGVSLNQDNYIIRINGVDQTYSVALVQGAEFGDTVIFGNVKLNKGANTVELITNNNQNPAGGGTYEATAPLVDCIRVTTSAVLMWDETYGLPMGV